MKSLLFTVLKRIDWENFKSASRIENIEENLMNLISNDEKISDKAYWNFDNHVVLQGDLCESGFYIIPILLRMLAETKNINKILNLLFELSNGSSYDFSTCKYEYVTFVTIKMPFLFYIPSSDKNAQTKILETACKEAIYEQKNILEYLLVDIDTSLQDYRTILDIFLNLRDYDIKKSMEMISNNIRSVEKRTIFNEYFNEL